MAISVSLEMDCPDWIPSLSCGMGRSLWSSAEHTHNPVNEFSVPSSLRVQVSENRNCGGRVDGKGCAVTPLTLNLYPTRQWLRLVGDLDQSCHRHVVSEVM